MKPVLAYTFPSGTPTADEYSITLVNNTAKTQDVTVPANELWVLQSVKITNPDDVTRNVTITLWNEAAKTNKILVLDSQNIATTDRLQIPSNDDHAYNFSNASKDFVLAAGMTIEVVWAAGGASTGATDADGLVIFYRKLSLR